MTKLVQSLRGDFNFIIIDLAPLGAVKDASAAAAFVDGYHLVVEWGKLPARLSSTRSRAIRS